VLGNRFSSPPFNLEGAPKFPKNGSVPLTLNFRYHLAFILESAVGEIRRADPRDASATLELPDIEFCVEVTMPGTGPDPRLKGVFLRKAE
jgi:hypothetical protein